MDETLHGQELRMFVNGESCEMLESVTEYCYKVFLPTMFLLRLYVAFLVHLCKFPEMFFTDSAHLVIIGFVRVVTFRT